MYTLVVFQKLTSQVSCLRSLEEIDGGIRNCCACIYVVPAM